MVYNNLMLLLKMYSVSLFLYRPRPGWCSSLLMCQAKEKLAFEKLVTMLNGVSRAWADQYRRRGGGVSRRTRTPRHGV